MTLNEKISFYQHSLCENNWRWVDFGIMVLGAESVMVIPTPQKYNILLNFYENFYTELHQSGQSICQALQQAEAFVNKK